MLAKLIATCVVLVRSAGANDWLKNALHVDSNIRLFLLIFVAVLFTYAFTQSEDLIRQNNKLKKKGAAKDN